MVCVIACRASPKGGHKRSAVQYPISGLSCRGIVKSALEDAGMPNGAFGSSCTGSNCCVARSCRNIIPRRMFSYVHLFRDISHVT